MPALPAWSGFSGDELAADELSLALWSTADPNDSFDILNGGLTSANYELGPGQQVPTWAIQPGSFAAGYYYGFDRRDTVTASQQVVSSPTYTIPANEFGYGLVSSFSHKVFLPYDCEAVFFSFQAWCKQVCTYWDTDGDGITTTTDDIVERFVVSPYVNGVRFPGLVHKLPHYMYSQTDPDVTPDQDSGTGGIQALQKWEHRWRYISGSGFFVNATDTTLTSGQAEKGVLTFDLYVYGNIQAPNKNHARIDIDSGGLTIIAIR